MIKYKELRWSNCFSYGENNKIRFDSADITQLVGKNGHGKSSIGLILEEVLYNTNSKGIKKANILNRYSNSKSYSIGLDFIKDGKTYTIETTRGSTQKVSLYCDGEDISSHTATSTFKDIEALIGYDHKTFSQIVYQSSTQSLEFLTATDTKRKKFLIDLLNLTKYSNALEVIKFEASEVSKKIAVVEGKVSQSNAWLARYTSPDLFIKQELEEVPEYPQELETELAEIRQTLATIEDQNKRRAKNAEYKKVLSSIELLPAPTEQFDDSHVSALRTDIAVCKNSIQAHTSAISKLQNTKDKCPTCGASLGVDHAHISVSLEQERTLKASLEKRKTELEAELTRVQQIVASHAKAAAARGEYEKFHALYDPNIPTEPLDEAGLSTQALKINKQIKDAKEKIDGITKNNAAITAHNARVDILTAQKASMLEELAVHNVELAALSKRAANLAVLVKAFSTTGLVAYKIECLVKDLEAITNEYLAEMSDGRFQLGFEISSSDKLNVVITDNGTDVDIAALSSGERARVNIATLLAIRKMMQSLSNTRSNLLILDETVENLDAEGKEKLIEVLLAEQGLNTFLISHGFSHPLLEKLHVVKTNNISRIET